ncbi:hypothetical protein AVEN_156438-1 [Araneus ventricosus]|uniref:Helitron helicase-like domain-containing protein n=1 Tax=Araneus ventricosus TaxID=182803 RepID=A0A4Y2QMN7_ARAVE|nr:hypothetical protein AVEN_156438-1 [Araneus ventricosus]
MNIICQFRKSINLAAERPYGGKFTSCCRKEKIKLEKPSDALTNEKCNLRILDQIDRFFRQHNRLSETYRMLREVESRVIAESNEAGEDVPVVNMVFRCYRHSDQRRYNAPTANEIAMVFVNSDGEPPF